MLFRWIKKEKKLEDFSCITRTSTPPSPLDTKIISYFLCSFNHLYKSFVLITFWNNDLFPTGELSLTTGPLIAGRPATLFCNIPVFSAAGQWNRDNEEFYVTQCDNSGFCSVETEGTKYRYSSNSSGISVTINNIDRSEQRVWTCDHTGYSPVSYTLSYNDNVFGK